MSTLLLTAQDPVWVENSMMQSHPISSYMHARVSYNVNRLFFILVRDVSRKVAGDDEFAC